MNTTQKYMQRALDLASLGRGHTSPNPVVGCVIVCDNKIIGEGYHEKYGGPHAEVNAVNAVKKKNLLKTSTVYVTLEPCSHFGKTPPCADLLIENQVAQVVVASLDPNPQVNGKGIARLRAAGITVETGVLESNAHELNRRFFTFHEKKRPYIFLKWAQTSDGYTARKNYDSKWISNVYSRQLVHKLRATEDAICVGYNTAYHDDPELTVRYWAGSDPIRIVIDPKNDLDKGLHLFDGKVSTLVYNFEREEEVQKVTWVKLKGVNWIEEFLADLYLRNVQSIIIEGGTNTLDRFITNNLWDEAHVYSSHQKFGDGIAAPILQTEPVKQQSVLGDTLSIHRNDSSR